MQPSDESSTVETEPVVLPRNVINLALRVLQLLAGVDSLTLQVIRCEGVWYLVEPSGKLERLG